MDISDAIKSIKTIKGISSYDEITTKQTIVLHVFQALGWNIFDKDEVLPEYAVEHRRVDYSLRIFGKNMVFVEVKKPSEELEKHEEQLLDYSFRQGIQLAILTNGITWWFYLPMLGEKWANRKFYAIDIQEQDIDSISSRFLELLGKQNVESGDALRYAEKIHENKKKRETIQKVLPDAWNKIVGEPDSLLIDLIAETTERICGFRPLSGEISHFLSKNSTYLQVPTFDKLEAQKLSDPKILNRRTEQASVRILKQGTIYNETDGRGGGLIRVTIDGKSFEGTSIPKLYLIVLKYIVDNGSINNIQLPTKTGNIRHFLFKGEKPIHQNKKPFTKPVSYGDYHLEAHVNREQGITYLGELCELIGYKFHVDLK